MRGSVLQFAIQTNQGFISGDDGKRYRFSGSDWNLNIQPEQGIRVDFDIEDGNNQAISIYEEPTDFKIQNQSKSRMTTALLALLLGGVGVHFFYLEAWGWGILSVILFWTYIPAIAALILAIRYFTMSDKEFQSKTKELIGKSFGKINL
jgi:TM2 domain-containing membrane protein YozV